MADGERMVASAIAVPKAHAMERRVSKLRPLMVTSVPPRLGPELGTTDASVGMGRKEYSIVEAPKSTPLRERETAEGNGTIGSAPVAEIATAAGGVSHSTRSCAACHVAATTATECEPLYASKRHDSSARVRTSSTWETHSSLKSRSSPPSRREPSRRMSVPPPAGPAAGRTEERVGAGW